jgi:2-polyprenyl-3-methyl-5-hydroxy-6-metoxy-1,4-benzoquinol methylase
MYAIEQGVPILVRDWQRHTQELDQARSIKPGWYLEEQLPEQSSPWRHHLRKRREYVESAIQECLQDNGQLHAATLLDLGCGDGNHLEWLQKYTDTLFGSDYNLLRLVRSSLRHPTASLFLADVLEYPARDEFFDMIFFNHVLEHIHDDNAALATVFRLLKPGGLLILGTPNEGAWWWHLAYRLQPETLKQTDHVHFYTAKEVVMKLKAQGFRIREVKHLGWGPPHWGWDGRFRKYRWVDDWFEWIGKIVIPHQASSLYILATKPESGKR